ncbi:hypothetical protein CRG98_007487 [Punica granatum]|uniref:Uncharacterized protein n=1 Tax=Punica granatum TaxID=22663 RepID=A0A2I0KUU2_PUNGR|nr:hypothetical protein CRG98_007487 [Punica granatum]
MGAGLRARARGCAQQRMRMDMSHAFFMWKSQEALMSINEGLSVVFNFLRYFGLGVQESKRKRTRDLGQRGGYPWADRGSHGRKGETGRKLRSRLVAH